MTNNDASISLVDAAAATGNSKQHRKDGGG